MVSIVGILYLQGCCVPHEKILKKLGVETRRIIYANDLDGCSALILPGGESTTMLKHITPKLEDAILTFAKANPVWGICAGSILMAKHVKNPSQKSLGLMDVTILRNGYGAQNESFIRKIPMKLKENDTFEGIFIRAPQIESIGDDVEVLAFDDEVPVFIEQDHLMATTFHPELAKDDAIHRYFLSKIES